MTKSVTQFDKAAIEEVGQGLTDMQRIFCDNLFRPGSTQTEAAVDAGYARGSAHVSAARLMRQDNVLEYIKTCVQHSLGYMSINAVNVVNELSNTAKSPYVRLQAAQDILDRSGHKQKEGASVNVGELTVSIDLS